MENEFNLKVNPYPYQVEGIKYGLDKKRLLIGDAPGLGKAQSLDSLIYTPKGAVQMGQVSIGQEIFGADGKIYTIIGVYPQGLKAVYRIKFSDGSCCESTLDHLWNVRDANRRRKGRGWITKTLQQILTHKLRLLRYGEDTRQGALKWEIPMCAPVPYSTKDYIIPPYSMGAILGDGYVSDVPHVTFSFSPRKESIIARIKREAPITLDPKERCYKGIVRLSLPNSTVVDKYHTENLYMGVIRRYGLNVKSGDKFIPADYLQGDPIQRLNLLRGLMDTDGICIKNRTIFHTISRNLAEGVKELVQSLGGIAIIHEYDRTGDNKPLEFYVNIRMDICPFSPELYKANEWHPSTRFQTRRYICSVEYIGDKECQCIATSSPDQLYLTNEFIVTHNTLQSIGIINTAQAFPCLVICPSALKVNWQREWEKFTERKALILDNHTRTSWPYLLQMKMFDVVVVNYESLRKFFVWGIESENKRNFRLKDVVFCPGVSLFKSVIIDESHKVKDATSQQAIFTKGIAAGKEYIILLSGTPLVNTPADLVPQLSIMNRLSDFGGVSGFARLFAQEGGLGNVGTAMREKCLIRREKEAVLKDLPPKTRIQLFIDIENREEYNVASEEIECWLREYKKCTDYDIARKMRMKALVRFMNLRSLAAVGKIKGAVEVIRLLLESTPKVIVFCSYHTVVDELCKIFPGAVRVTGRDSAQDKQAAVDAFQNDPETHIIICSIKAAGVGLTLTASSTVVFVEMAWTYADCLQAEDRAHRIGAKDNVTCYYLLAPGTIDGALYRIVYQKKSMAQALMACSDEVPMDQKWFEELADELLRKE